MSQRFNLSDWILRVGYQRRDEPPVVYSVQPVALVADHRSLTPDLRGPSAIFGGLASGAPANFATYEFRSNAPGGAVLGSFSFHTQSPTNLSLVIRETDTIFIAPVQVVPQIMRGPIRSSGLIGRILVGSIDTGANPRLPGGALNIAAFWPAESIFVPAGHRLVIQVSDADVDLNIAHTCQELPAERGT